MVKYEIVGNRVVTPILKLIDDNIKVKVDATRELAAGIENENGINPNPEIRTKKKSKMKFKYFLNIKILNFDLHIRIYALLKKYPCLLAILPLIIY